MNFDSHLKEMGHKHILGGSQYRKKNEWVEVLGRTSLDESNTVSETTHCLTMGWVVLKDIKLSVITH